MKAKELSSEVAAVSEEAQNEAEEVADEAEVMNLLWVGYWGKVLLLVL